MVRSGDRRGNVGLHERRRGEPRRAAGNARPGGNACGRKDEGDTVVRGHIRKRGANSWEIKYDIARAEGGRHTVYRSFKGTRREAQAELARLLARVADGGHVDPSKLTVGDLVRQRVSQWSAAGAISPKTAQRYGQLLVA